MRLARFIAIATLLAIFSFFIFSNVSRAQLGEVAGEPTFYVNISGTYSYNYTFVNQGSSPIPFRTMITSFKTSVKNATAPIVTAIPASGTIPPNSQIRIRVNVYLPAKNNTAGMKWQGVLEVVVNSTSNTTGGAVINEGVAKIITVVATTPKPDYTADILIAAVIIAIIAVVSATVYTRNRRKSVKKAKAVSRKTASNRRASMAKKRSTSKARAKPRKNAASKRKTASRKRGRGAAKRRKKR
jgi:hypothetical protein